MRIAVAAATPFPLALALNSVGAAGRTVPGALTAAAPPVFLYYRGQSLKPSKDRSDDIHQIGFGLRLKEKMDALKVECEIVAGWPQNPESTGPDKTDVEFVLRHFGMKQ